MLLLLHLLGLLGLLPYTTANVPTLSLPIDLPTDQRYAFVTLLYNDAFALGVRTLGQSLRATKDKKRHNIDHVVLITPKVSKDMEEWLKQDGWTVKRVEAAGNPNHTFDKRLHGVYTKLEIFQMTDYHRVVYLDADTTLLENVDELFLCGPFCAVMRHSELINSGVIVAEPSETLYNDMKRKAAMGLYSYTGGDQGFFNSYYPDYAACPYFEPMRQIGLGSDGSRCRRLPHRYNGDWPIAGLNGKLEMVRTKNYMQKEFGEFRRARILHYTIGSFKPWDWYSPIIFPFTYHWTRAASELPRNPHDKQQLQKEMTWIALGSLYFLVWLLVVLQGGGSQHANFVRRQSHGGCGNPIKFIFSFLRNQLMPRHSIRSTSISWNQDPLSTGSLLMHLLIGHASFGVAFCGGFLMVPEHTYDPFIGFGIFLVWTFGIFFSFYSIYIYQWYLQGLALITTKSPKSADVDLEHNSPLKQPWSTRGNKASSTLQAARAESFTYATVFASFVIWFVLIRLHTHIVSFGEVLPPMVGLGVTLILGLTVVFYRLPLLWYQEGLSA